MPRRCGRGSSSRFSRPDRAAKARRPGKTSERRHDFRRQRAAPRHDLQRLSSQRRCRGAGGTACVADRPIDGRHGDDSSGRGSARSAIDRQGDSRGPWLHGRRRRESTDLCYSAVNRRRDAGDDGWRAGAAAQRSASRSPRPLRLRLRRPHGGAERRHRTRPGLHSEAIFAGRSAAQSALRARHEQALETAATAPADSASSQA